MRSLQVGLAALTLAQGLSLFARPARADEPEPAGESAPEDASGDTAPAEAPEKPDEPLEVSVAGSRVQQTSGSVHVVSPKQLERFEHDDPHSVLLQVPGVYVRGEDGFGLRPNIGIRGAASDRSKKITLMEDGVLFGPAPYSAPAAYYFPLITRMHSVQVLKGPAAIVHGPHTVGGAIDLVTAPIPSERATLVDVAFGEFLHRKLHVRQGLADDRRGVLVEAVHLANDGFKELDGGGDTGFARTELMMKARYAFVPRADFSDQIELKVGYSGEVSNETYLGLTDEDFRETPYRRYGASRLDRMEANRTQFQLRYQTRLRKDLELTATAYRHDFHRIWRKVNAFRGASLADVLANPGDPRNAIFYGVLTGSIPPSTDAETLMIGPNDRTFVSQGAQARFSFRPKAGPLRHNIEYGLRLHFDSIRRLHTQDGFRVEGESLVPEASPTETTADNDASTLALSMYALDAVTWGPLTVTAGARLESIRGEAEDRLSGRRDLTIQQVVLPGAGAFFALTEDAGLLAGVHQGFSPVPPGQADIVRPEKSVNYEAGFRFAPRRFRAEVIGFFNDYRNLTNICTLSTGCVDANLDRQFDGGRARVLGVESYVESELKVREDLAIPGRLGYTLTDARFLTSFTSADPTFGDVEEEDRLPYVPTHQLAASIGAETPRWGTNAAVTYADAMREIASQGEPAPGTATDAYLVFDLAAHVRPLRWLTLYAVARNLFDNAYIASRRPYGARPGAPRWVQVGAKAEF